MDKISTSSSVVEAVEDKSKGSLLSILLRLEGTADFKSSGFSDRGLFWAANFSAKAERARLPANVSIAGLRPGKGKKGVADKNGAWAGP